MRFEVVERRALETTYTIEAEDERAALRLEGEILDEQSTDTWADEILTVREVPE